jgi:ABC-type branched-subunit amino acid transport system ATPase component
MVVMMNGAVLTEGAPADVVRDQRVVNGYLGRPPARSVH